MGLSSHLWAVNQQPKLKNESAAEFEARVLLALDKAPDEKFALLSGAARAEIDDAITAANGKRK